MDYVQGKPFTRKRPARLFRVCKVVAQKLGVAHLTDSYAFDDEPEEHNEFSYAYTLCGRYGWETRIVFLPKFFERHLRDQLITIVHEHIHVMMLPQDQVTHHIIESLIVKSKQDVTEDRVNAAREIVVTSMQTSLLELLMPHIKKAL